MRNKNVTVLLASVITVLCLFYLSFTFVSRNIEADADAYAQGDYFKKQDYLDSMWNMEVYFGFTYGEIKQSELNLGLDLQGGMHVTLEVSPKEILRVLAGNKVDANFEKALSMASEQQKSSQERFTNLFFEAYQSLNDKPLAGVFASSANRGQIDFKTSDEEVIKVVLKEVDDAIDRAYNIIQTRIDKFGVVQPNIQRIQGTGRIQLELPGVDNPKRVRKLLQGVAKLEFLEVYDMRESIPYIQRANDYLVQQEKAKTSLTDSTKSAELAELVKTDGALSDSILASNADEVDDADAAADFFSSINQGDSTSADENDSTLMNTNQDVSQNVSKLFSLLRSQYALMYEVKDTGDIKTLLRDPQVRAFFPQDAFFAWSKPSKNSDALDTKLYTELYILRKGRQGAPLNGESVIDARQSFDQVGQPEITMMMNVDGARKWKRLTAKNIQKQVAIVLDGTVYSAPVVQSEIPNGRSSISGNFTIEEAKDLANILKAGKLPAPTNIVEEAVVGPSLGLEAQKQGLISIISGLVLVVLFMILYYNKGGVVANAALLINIFFIIGVMAQLNAALSLPGIAGIVLTIGMSIDANVLIFERVKEELLKGKRLFEAIQSGYDRAFWTIFDSNLTTLLTATFLYVFGSGPIKGFATTLIVGIVCSFFSAVFITRVIVYYMTVNKDKANISFETALSKGLLKAFNFDFLSKRKVAYVISAVVITVGIVLLSTKGLNMGVDFQGGRSYIVKFSHDVVPSDIRTALSDALDNASVQAKTFNGDNQLKVTTSYMVEDESTAADSTVIAKISASIAEITGDTYVDSNKGLGENEFSIPSTIKVGATIADDIQQASTSAVAFSLLAIFLYIFIRFQRIGFSLGLW